MRTMRTWMLAAVVASCSPAMPQVAPHVGSGPAGQSGSPGDECRAEQGASRLMVVEWPATDKATLQAQAESGLVVVSWDGCRLDLLTGCSATGRYLFTGTTPARDRIDVQREDELRAKLPLSFAALQGLMRAGTTLHVDYVAVGARRASVTDLDKSALSGRDCLGATHFVRSIVVGAHEIFTRSASRASADASVLGARAGGSHEQDARVLRTAGDLYACVRPRSSEGPSLAGPVEPAPARSCGALLQVELAQLTGEASGAASEVAEPQIADASAEEQARSKYMLVEQELRAFESSRVEGRDRESIARSVQDASARARQLEGAYREVLALGRPAWSVAAQFRVGYVWDRLAEVIAAVEPPAPIGADPELRRAFTDALEGTVRPLEDRAVAAYRLAHELAVASGVRSPEASWTLERLNYYVPAEFPFERGDRPAFIVFRPLGPRGIQRVVRSRAEQIRACYDRALARRPDLEGRLEVRFVISPTGRVQTAEVVSSELGDPAVEECFVSRIRGWAFPITPGGDSVTVNYPFMLRSD